MRNQIPILSICITVIVCFCLHYIHEYKMAELNQQPGVNIEFHQIFSSLSFHSTDTNALELASTLAKALK